jgi:hypothetical protein
MNTIVLRAPSHRRSSWSCSRSRVWASSAERLVHQDDLGIVDERAHDVGPLPHAAGELVRVVLLEAGQPDPLDGGGRASPALRARHAAQLERELDVLAQRPPRVEVVGLGDVADLGVDAAHRRALVEDLARRDR